ncbi:MAG: inorganic phosphate transporter [Nitrospinales bacterium]
MVSERTSSIPKIPSLSIFFAGLLTCVTAYFIYWGLNYTNYNHVTIFALATLFGIFMAFNIGGNDVANSFGTSVGAGTLTIKQALAVAAVFEISGAMLAGGKVTDTIRNGIVDLTSAHLEPMQFVYIMISSLLAAGLWLLYATRRGYPVSTTHSIIGGIVGSSLALGLILSGAGTAFALVHWGQIGTIVISWIISPVLGGLVSYFLFSFIKERILRYNAEAEVRLKDIRIERQQAKERHKRAFETLSDIQQVSYTAAMVRDASDDREDVDYSAENLETDFFKDIHEIERKQQDIRAHRALEDYVPLIAAFGSMVISSMVLFKGLEGLDLKRSAFGDILIIMMIGCGVWMGTAIFAKSMRGRSLSNSTFLLFSWLQVFTAAGFAFSHGANDIANAIGPFAAILDVLRNGHMGSEAPVPPTAMMAFGVALIAGLWFIGREVIQTVGYKLTKMHPSSGFAAELSAAVVVLLSTSLGIPVSSTHILIGAVLGVGLVNGQANWDLMKPIGLAWVITLPAAMALGAVFSAILFYTF